MLDAKIAYYQLIASSLMMAVVAFVLMKYAQLSGSLLFFTVLVTLFYIIFVFTFAVNFGKKTWSQRPFLICTVLFLLFLASFVAAIFSSGVLLFDIVEMAIVFLDDIGSAFVYFFLFFFALFFSAFCIRVMKNKKLGALFLVFGIMILWYFFLSGGSPYNHIVNDESLLSVSAVHSLLNGTNPYTTSIYDYMYEYSKANRVGVTPLTTNLFVSVVSYPALYFLSYLPFYLINKPNISNLGSINMGPYLAVSLLLLTLVMVFTIKKEHLGKPIFGLLLMFVIGISFVASVVTYLALALLILAYVKIDKNYAGLIMGLGFSIHQQIWIPLLLLLVYSFNNYGFDKGIRDLAFAAIVFLLINGYFIIQNPGAFIGAVLEPANSAIFPEAWAPFGYYILANYGVPLSYFSVLPVLVLAALILIFVYFNKKILVGLFALVPLAFMQRGLYVYYTFFILFFVFTLFLDEKKTTKQLLKKYLVPNFKTLVIAVCVIIFVAVVALYMEHQAYLANFNVTIVNQSLVLSGSHNYSIYASDLRYGSVSNKTGYVYVISLGGSETFEYGLFNKAIVPDPVVCNAGDYRCMFNINRIVLNGSGGANEYELKLRLENIGAGNGTVGANASNFTIYYPYLVSVAIYNSNYYYIAPVYYNSTIASERASVHIR